MTTGPGCRGTDRPSPRPSDRRRDASRSGSRPRPRPSTGRRSTRAWARIGEHDVFESVWMNDHLTDIGRERARPELRGADGDGRARPPRARQVGRPRRAVGHVPPSGGAGQGGDGHGPRDGRAVHPRASAPAGTRASTRRSGSRCRRCPSGSTGSSRRSTCSGRCARTRRATDAGRDPRPTRSTRSTEATNEPPPLTPGGPPIWLGGQKRRGIALAAAVADGWLLPAVVARQAARPTWPTSARGATRSSPRSRRSGATRRRSRSAPRSRPGRPPRTGARRSTQAREAVERGATHVILGMPPRLGAAGVDAVAREIAEPLREAIG